MYPEPDPPIAVAVMFVLCPAHIVTSLLIVVICTESGSVMVTVVVSVHPLDTCVATTV